MKPFLPPDLTPLSPELLLLGMTMVLLFLGSISKTDDTKPVMRLGIFTLFGVLVMLFNFCAECTTTFGGMFITDTFALFMKGLVVTGSAFSLLMAGQYMEQQKISRFEYPILVLFSTLGMMLMISANDLMALYVGLELQSLPLYVLASIRRDSLRSTEAGLKYFILGALSSGLLLYGASLIYGFAGATGFDQIAHAVKMQTEVNLGLLVGMVLLISGMAFKISAVPFHMWVPDVYQGAPTSVTAFFAIAPKVAAMALLIRVLMGPFGEMAEDWRQVVALLSVASMGLGAFAAIVQTNIKRLLAYSSIGHMGYALVGIAAGGAAGVQAVVFYMSIYMVMSIGAFAVVLMMQRKGEMAEEISDLSGLAADRPVLAAAMTALMFSMAGIPPLAGFFGKLFIFQIAVAQGLYALAVIGVLSSVVAAYYYLRVIKIMYFDAPANPLDVVKHAGLRVSLTLACLAVLLFVIAPSFLMDAAAVAAGAFVKDVTL